MWEPKEITESTTGVAELDGQGATWQVDIWNLTIPFNQKHKIGPSSIFSCYLVGDDAAEMPDKTLVRVVKRDMDEQETVTLLSTLYQNCKEFTNKAKLQKLTTRADILCTAGEHIAIMVNGADVATTGDTDASASNFRLTSLRERKSIV